MGFLFNFLINQIFVMYNIVIFSFICEVFIEVAVVLLKQI